MEIIENMGNKFTFKIEIKNYIGYIINLIFLHFTGGKKM
jgi:hypothetical protein